MTTIKGIIGRCRTSCISIGWNRILQYVYIKWVETSGLCYHASRLVGMM